MPTSPLRNHDLPPDVQAALEALDRQLSRWIHNLLEIMGPSRDDYDAGQAAFDKLCGQHPTLREPFYDHPSSWRFGSNDSFVARARFRSFIEGVAVALSPSRSDDVNPPPFKPIFTRLLEIAERHRFGAGWAKAQALAMIQRHSFLAPLWLRLECDGNADGPVDQFRAPMVFTIKPGPSDPSEPDPDPDRKMDAAPSAALLKKAENKFISTLAGYIERDADDAILNAATAEPAKPPQAGKVIEAELVQRSTPKAPPEVQAEKADRQKPHGYPEAVIAAARKDILAAQPTDLIEYQTAREGLNISKSTLGDWIRKGILKRAGKRSMLIAVYVQKCLDPGYVEKGLRKARELKARELKAEQLKARRG